MDFTITCQCLTNIFCLQHNIINVELPLSTTFSIEQQVKKKEIGDCLLYLELEKQAINVGLTLKNTIPNQANRHKIFQLFQTYKDFNTIKLKNISFTDLLVYEVILKIDLKPYIVK